MSEIIKSYGDFNLRAIRLNDIIWFHAGTVATGLGYVNASKAYKDHCKHLKLFSYNESLELGFSNPNRRGEYFIRLSDVNRLIMRSSLSSAEAIQDWVNEDVIPSILATGSYSVVPVLPQDYPTALRALAAEVEARIKVEAERDHITTLFDQELSYCSIIRASRYLGVHETVFNWRTLKKWTLQNGLEVKRVPTPRFEYQLLYPIKAFSECYPQYDFSKIEPDKIENRTELALNCLTLSAPSGRM